MDEVIGGRWKKLKGIGEGGQAFTYLVEDLSNLGSYAVLKMTKQEKASRKQRGRLEREAFNINFLNGEGADVPSLLDHDAEADQPYLVMEHIDGPPLERFVKDSGEMNLEDAVSTILKLTETLTIMDHVEIVHRDIKPQNIILRNADPSQAVLVDFGLSFTFDRDEYDRLTAAGEQVQNRFLTLPEQMTFGYIRDPRSDITCTCGVLFFCLTKRQPRSLFDGDGKTPHRAAGFAFTDLFDKVTSQKLNSFFDRSFQARIDDRFQTVEDLNSRLLELADADAGPKFVLDEVIRETAKQLFEIDPNERKKKRELAASEAFAAIRHSFVRLGGKVTAELKNMTVSAITISGAGYRNEAIQAESVYDEFRTHHVFRSKIHLVGVGVAFQIGIVDGEIVVFSSGLDLDLGNNRGTSDGNYSPIMKFTEFGEEERSVVFQFVEGWIAEAVVEVTKRIAVMFDRMQ